MARSAIVVGGGIGGLATARALLATGWDVTVLEQASALAPVGAGLGLAPNGVVRSTACQALEDAVTLALALQDTSDVPTALALYDRTRRPRSQRLVRASARAGRMAQASHPVLAGLRNLAAWLTPTPLYLRATTGTFSWTPSTALTAR